MTRLNASKMKIILRVHAVSRVLIYLVDNMFNFYDIDIIIGAHSNTEYLSIEWVNSRN